MKEAITPHITGGADGFDNRVHVLDNKNNAKATEGEMQSFMVSAYLFA
jgi:hypothetical protein